MGKAKKKLKEIERKLEEIGTTEVTVLIHNDIRGDPDVIAVCTTEAAVARVTREYLAEVYEVVKAQSSKRSLNDVFVQALSPDSTTEQMQAAIDAYEATEQDIGFYSFTKKLEV